MFTPIFVLIEEINGESTQTPIFVRDRKIITFGRSASCEYKLLKHRNDSMNQKISRMQATLKEGEDGWYLHPGCITESAREGILPGRPGSPLFIESTSFIGESIKMDLKSEIFLYREIDDHARIVCTNEEGLEAMSNSVNPEGTQSYDLIDALRTDIKRLEDLVLIGFSETTASISTLLDSDRIQNRRLDTHSKTLIKMSGAVFLVFLAFAGGSQLLDSANKQDFAYNVVKLIMSTGSGIGGAALLKNAIEKRSLPRQ